LVDGSRGLIGGLVFWMRQASDNVDRSKLMRQ